MTITITLDHSDIVGTDVEEFKSLFIILQSYAKMTKGPMTLPPNAISNAWNEAAEERKKEIEKKSVQENTVEPSTQTAEDSVDRKKIEAEIKKIALDGKEKGSSISSKIKDLIQGYGVEKLSEVPAEKLNELLEKVKAL